MRRSAAVGGMVPLLLCLAGCTAPQAVPAPSTVSGPPAFPRVQGPVTHRSEPTPGDWLLRVEVSDAAAAYRRARALLTGHGYQVTNDAPAPDGGNGQACTTDLCVSFTAVQHPGSAPTVDYEVFHSTGVAG